MLYNNKSTIMENQGKTKRQMKSSYFGAFVGFVGIIIMLIYLVLS